SIATFSWVPWMPFFWPRDTRSEKPVRPSVARPASTTSRGAPASSSAAVAISPAMPPIGSMTRIRATAPPVDQRGIAAGAETVVDVHTGHVGRTGIEHGQKRRHTAQRGAVADAGGHGHHRATHHPRHRGGERPLHSGHRYHHGGRSQIGAPAQKPVHAGHA